MVCGIAAARKTSGVTWLPNSEPFRMSAAPRGITVPPSAAPRSDSLCGRQLRIDMHDIGDPVPSTVLGWGLPTGGTLFIVRQNGHPRIRIRQVDAGAHVSFQSANP